MNAGVAGLVPLDSLGDTGRRIMPRDEALGWRDVRPMLTRMTEPWTLGSELRHCPQTSHGLARGKRRGLFCAVPAELGLEGRRFGLSWEILSIRTFAK